MDVAFLLTAGASAIINIAYVAAVATVIRIPIALGPQFIGPSAAELALIVIALALYVSDIIMTKNNIVLYIEEYCSIYS